VICPAVVVPVWVVTVDVVTAVVGADGVLDASSS
jgi:hypothetical protein